MDINADPDPEWQALYVDPDHDPAKGCRVRPDPDPQHCFSEVAKKGQS